MEFSKEEQHAIINFICVNIYCELVSVYGDKALGYSNMNRWMTKFKTGSVSSADLLWLGWPCSS
ncbi:hypothetical protein C0J52_17386 [Blattella germanica]|nr:hypothetical protein C0J52_17386 [Blattella germanica]